VALCAVRSVFLFSATQMRDAEGYKTQSGTRRRTRRTGAFAAMHVAFRDCERINDFSLSERAENPL
jgi:hypothetical protein